MKGSELAALLLQMVEDDGDFEVITAKDQEGNGYNLVRGVDFVYHANDGEDYVFDTLKEADDSGYGFEDLSCKILVYV